MLGAEIAEAPYFWGEHAEFTVLREIRNIGV